MSATCPRGTGRYGAAEAGLASGLSRETRRLPATLVCASPRWRPTRDPGGPE